MFANQLYAPLGAEIMRLTQLFSTHNTILYIDNQNVKNENIKLAFDFLLPDVNVIYLPAWDCLPYDRISPSVEILNQRLNTLSQLLNLSGKTLIVSSAINLLQKLPPRNIIERLHLELKVGSKIAHQELPYILHELGYTRSTTANVAGEFAIRGGIIDVVISSDQGAYRLNFFGNDIDSIKLFDPETQTSIKHIDGFTLKPASELLLNDQTLECFKHQFRQFFGSQNNQLFQDIVDGHKAAGMEHLLPLFYDQLDNVFNYLPKETALVVTHQITELLDKVNTDIEYCYNARLTAKASEYIALPPKQLYLTVEELQENIKAIYTAEITALAEMKDGFREAPNINIQAVQANASAMSIFSNMLIKDPQFLQKKKIICCFSAGSLERIQHMLQDHELSAKILTNYQDINRLPTSVIGIAILPLEHGVIKNEIIWLSEQDLLGIRLSRSAKKKAKMPQLLQELGNFELGELIVHKEFGIGRFAGLETLQVENIFHDFIKLLYLNDDTLYVPIENIELLSKYGDSPNTPLDKLGSSAWQHRKARLKNKLKMAASELLKIAAERETKQGTIYEPISELYERFCEKFLYVETDDQQAAIEAVAQDLTNGKPMDRLVCGDVGFGKTEIALRAACMVACSAENAQVAIIVPTTLLARQHYKNFSERFAHLPIRVAQLSRFVARTEINRNKLAIAKGEIDVVIGTHALLANDMKFNNLGLIIIDEEQHFGVAQKEKLKKLKANSHVLTLSATPIPRTLQMSISGIKELSLITTPPIDRLPIKTAVMPFDSFILREAILREKARGGRIFVVTPRIAYLNEMQAKLMEIVPEIKMVQAHGQMPPARLDQIMNDFYDGQYDLLISTTIIESGLDIPFANTIIIDRADMFGLAQLYQIRGRVGRSNAKAYAYLLTRPGTHLNDTAVKRLSVIKSLDSLGVGFSVATHDMDIRGYGNLVGEEQSGHIKEVGIELYQAMLTEAIDNLKSEHEVDEDREWSPLLNIGLSIQIPEDYIQDSTLRLSIYRKIAALNDIESLESFAVEMIDRFGPMPDSTRHLFNVIKIKQLAKAINATKIDCGKNAVVISFKPEVEVEKILAFIAQHSGDSKLRPDGKLIITRCWQTAEAKVKGIENILSKLC